MEITIIHASRCRPLHAEATHRSWINNASNKNSIEYILSIDNSDPYLATYAAQFSGRDVKKLVTDNHSAIEAFNRGAKHSGGNLLIAISDDFNIAPPHWDEHLLAALKGKSDYLVKTDDGAQPWIITLPIMDRVYYERFGYIYYPDYKHLFCDTEMTHVGDLLNRRLTIPIKFTHNHYTTGNTKRDAINIKNDATWEQGEKLYLSRMDKDFDLVNPPGVLRCDDSHVRWLNSKGYKIQQV